MVKPLQNQPDRTAESIENREPAEATRDEDPLEQILERMADEVRGIALTDDFLSESRRVLESHAAEHPELSDEIRSMGKVILTLEQEGRQRQVQNRTPREGQGGEWGNRLEPVARNRVATIGAEDISLDEMTAEEMVPTIQGFRILREIGRGGMGVVFEAEQIALRRRVAVKVLPERESEEKKNAFTPETDCESGHTLDSLHGNESPVSRFLREARIVARLHHTNIVPVLEAGCERGMYWYAMQLIYGFSLDRILRQLRQGERESLQDYGIPQPGTMAYFLWICQRFLQVLDALAHVHHQGLLHRDIKPGNLILEPDGRIWITDFGLARMKDRPGCGHAVGTLKYMAPEQRRGVATTLTDLYAVGLTLYEMFALQPAFVASGRMELIEQVENGRVSHPLAILVPELPLDLVRITEKAIQFSPEARYQTAEAFADDLRRFLEGRPVSARLISPWEKFLRWRRRNPWIYFPLLTAATAVTIAFIVGWSGWIMTRNALKDEAFQRYQAESNLALVVEEQELAREQRDRAERNLRLSLDILDSAFPTLATRKAFAVYSIPSPSERTQLETLLRFYEELTRGNETNPRLQAELAKTLARIGTVQLTLGEPGEAIHSFEKSLVYEENAAKSEEQKSREGEAAVIVGMIDIKGMRGIAKNTESTGNTKEDKNIENKKNLERNQGAGDVKNTNNIEVVGTVEDETTEEEIESRQVRIAGIHNELGYAKRLVGPRSKTARGNSAGDSGMESTEESRGTATSLSAAEEYHRALAILELYHSPMAQLERIRTLNALGILDSEPRNAESPWNAESCHRRAVMEADQLLATGNRPEYLFARAQSQRLLIQTLRTVDESKYEAEMESLATAAIKTLRTLITENPSFPEYRKELAQVLMSPGDPQISHARLSEAAEITDRLVEQFPYVPEYQLLAASVQARHALQFFSEGNLNAGAKEIYDAAAHLRQIQGHFPELLGGQLESNEANSSSLAENIEATLRRIAPFGGDTWRKGNTKETGDTTARDTATDTVGAAKFSGSLEAVSEYLRRIATRPTAENDSATISQTALDPLSDMVDQLTRWFMY